MSINLPATPPIDQLCLLTRSVIDKNVCSRPTASRDIPKMTRKQLTLVLTLLSLMAYFSSSWTEETADHSDGYRPAEENITRALIDMTGENLLRSFGIDIKRKPSKTFTPHDYMINVYSKLSGENQVVRKTRITTVRGIIDTGESHSWLRFCACYSKVYSHPLARAYLLLLS